MPSATVNSTSFGTPDFENAGQWIEDLEIKGPLYELDFVASPGVDGVGSKNYGFREQIIVLDCRVVAGSENDCVSSCQSILNALGSNRGYNSTIAGVVYKGCFLDANSSSFKQPHKTGFGTFWAAMNIVLRAKRLN